MCLLSIIPENINEQSQFTKIYGDSCKNISGITLGKRNFTIIDTGLEDQNERLRSLGKSDSMYPSYRTNPM